MKDLTNRVALVTGGSRGIGAAVALALARAGASVAVNYRERADAANAVCGEIKGMGRKAIAVQADVSVVTDAKRMAAEVEAYLGGIDILVNNAGIAHPRKLEEITEAEWDEVQGGDHRADPLLRLIIHSRRHHGECHCSRAD